jgi:hypothetical protein
MQKSYVQKLLQGFGEGKIKESGGEGELRYNIYNAL